MDYLTVSLSLLLVVGALALILYPLQRQRRAGDDEAVLAAQMLENYEVRYQAGLAVIKDLMFDYEMGKVSEPDYQALLSKAKLEAAEIRRQIDRLSAHQAGEQTIDAALDREIENLVAQMRHEPRDGNDALLQEVDAEIESLKVAAAPPGDERPVCPHCAREINPDDAFCSGCGQPVAEPDGKSPAGESACPACGYLFQAGDAFCARCGAALDAKSAEIMEPLG